MILPSLTPAFGAALLQNKQCTDEGAKTENTAWPLVLIFKYSDQM